MGGKAFNTFIITNKLKIMQPQLWGNGWRVQIRTKVKQRAEGTEVKIAGTIGLGLQENHEGPGVLGKVCREGRR